MCPDFSITIPFMLLALTPSYYIFAKSANLYCLSLPDKTTFSIDIHSIRFLNSIISNLYKKRRTRFFKVVHDLNNPVLRFISYDSLFPDINLTFVRFCVYSINIASPKLKNRYLSLTASSYAASTCSLPASALTSMISVDSGKWKFVIRQSSTLNL